MANFELVELDSFDELLSAVKPLQLDSDETPRSHSRLQMIYADKHQGGLVLNYLASGPRLEPFTMHRIRPRESAVSSIAAQIPLAGWYEREIADLFGLQFRGSPDQRRLVLHQGAHRESAPMSADALPATPSTFDYMTPELPEIEGENLQQLSFGPIRADVVETGKFLFIYSGEGIIHLEMQLFYKHRGMEQRFEGRDIRTAAVVAERISGIDSVAHALCLSLAVEESLGTQVPERAQQVRVILAELERLYNHLHYFALLSKLTTLKVGESHGLYLEEKVKQINSGLCGDRLLRGLVAPGGLRTDVDLSHLREGLALIAPEIEAYLGQLFKTRSFLDRLETTGILSPKVAFEQGATGPVERASNLARDLRVDHPYSGYHKAKPKIAVEGGGDALARARIRREEIFGSLGMIDRTLSGLSSGQVAAPCEAGGASGEGVAWVEATRGTLIYAVRIEDGRLARVKIKEPSFSNWRCFPFTVHGTNMMDYAINEASFGLSTAGCDR